MKRVTHIIIGAAVALPLAAPLSPALAAATVWWGMAGGGFPDWLDLRSDYSHTMKHRGLSHSILAAVVIGFGFWLLLGMASALDMSGQTRATWTYAFALGYLSHIIADACTHAGVRLWLPFSQRKWWLLPRFLRGTASGKLDAIVRMAALVLIGVYLAGLLVL